MAHANPEDDRQDGQGISKEVDSYIAQFTPEVRAILQRIRATIRTVAPDATEKISYRIPAFARNGVFIYFAAFKNHVGVYPPVRGDDRLQKALAPYQGEKGNLKFPLDRPMPYALIKRVAKALLAEHLGRTASTQRRGANARR